MPQINVRPGGVVHGLLLAMSVAGLTSCAGEPSDALRARAMRLPGEVARLEDEGRHAQAIAHAEEIVRLYEEAVGADHPDVSSLLHALGRLHRERDPRLAEVCFTRALNIRLQTFGPTNIYVAESQLELALLFEELGDARRARPLYQEAFSIYDLLLSQLEKRDRKPSVLAPILAKIAMTQGALGAGREAEAAYERLFAMNAEGVAIAHEGVIGPLDDLARVYEARREEDAAERWLRRAFTLKQRAFGGHSPEVAASLIALARVVDRADRYVEAQGLAEQARHILARTFGGESAQAAAATAVLASSLYHTGRRDRAKQMLVHAIPIVGKARGMDHPVVAAMQDLLGRIHQDEGDDEAAERLFHAALDSEEARGRHSIGYAARLERLAALYQTVAKYDVAESLLLAARKVHQDTVGLEHPSLAGYYANWGRLYHGRGDYTRAEDNYRYALGLLAKARRLASRESAAIYNNLARLYEERGEHERALDAYGQALAIFQASGSPDQAGVLINMARLDVARGDLAQAELRYQGAQAILAETRGAESSAAAEALGGLGLLYMERSAYDEAERLLRDAVSIQEGARGPWHPDLARALGNLATVLSVKDRGRLDEAKEHRSRELAILKRAFGARHPAVAASLENLAMLHAMADDMDEAVRLQAESSAIRDAFVEVNISTGSEAQKRAYMETLRASTDLTVSLHVRGAPGSRAAARLALTAILRRKGLILDAMTDGVAALRRRLAPRDQEIFDELVSVRAQLARHFASDAGSMPIERYRVRLERLERRSDALEADLSRQSAAFGAEQRPVTVEEVAAALPEGAVLVEIARHRIVEPREPHSGGAARERYIAYVLHRDGALGWADLGEAAAIDRLVGDLRKSLSSTASDVEGPARRLYAATLQPIQGMLYGTGPIFFSPDDRLHLIPVAALVDESGRYLVDRYSITYLTSGRDLLRASNGVAPRDGAVIFADPSFDARVAKDTESERGVRHRLELSDLVFAALPGTSLEALVIARSLHGARVFAGPEATEAAVKSVKRPAVLHIATHGFFLPSDKGQVRGANALLARMPLLRSGLALAGANAREGGGEDGILTALEASGLDLYGTKLVVLSACETGVGETPTGDGVHGLRRAFALAGSETQVMSLWRVDDQATRELMEAYYKRLLEGRGRSDAMRDAQLEVRGRNGREHPHDWASFIVSGDPSPLRARAIPDLAEAHPGPRGCACSPSGVADGVPNAHGVGIFLACGILVAAMRSRRRRRR